METVTVVLTIALAVTASGFLARLVPGWIPLPLIQISLGVALSLVGFSAVLDPDLFFLLFIPPLLFLDGWRIPLDVFIADLSPILLLAVGLVFFTVLGVGLLIQWLLPAVPPATAFALAAVLAPTDPVALSAIKAGTRVPARLLHVLQGEALLNDASGLVSFRFAVAALLTGSFSLPDAAVNFVLLAAGGVLVGRGVSALTWLINRWLINQAGEEPGTEVLVSLLIPFLAYLAAEQLHVSGILAAAAAGVTMQYTEGSGRLLALTRMQRNVVWTTLQTALNGSIFVLLGEQLPRILSSMAVQPEGSPGRFALLLGYAVAITASLTMLRFVGLGFAETAAAPLPTRRRLLASFGLPHHVADRFRWSQRCRHAGRHPHPAAPPA